MDDKTFLLRIKGYTPETIPMERLAEYMKQFAVLLGQIRAVHFDKVTKSSTNVLARVEFDALPQVNQRVREVQAGAAPNDALLAAMTIDRMLANDNTSGAIIRLNPEEEEMIPFLGAERPVPPVFGPISQATTLDGIVIRVGGRRDEVPVHIQTRDRMESHCVATRGLAQEFGRHLFGQELRFYGDGKWLRDEEGNWLLQKFVITRYEPLAPMTLKEAIADLRAVPGRNWVGTDPWHELRRLNDDEAE